MRRRSIHWGGVGHRCWGIVLLDWKPVVGFQFRLTYSWSQKALDFALILICLRVQIGYHFVDPRTLEDL